MPHVYYDFVCETNKMSVSSSTY